MFLFVGSDAYIATTGSNARSRMCSPGARSLHLRGAGPVAASAPLGPLRPGRRFFTGERAGGLSATLHCVVCLFFSLCLLLGGARGRQIWMDVIESHMRGLNTRAYCTTSHRRKGRTIGYVSWHRASLKLVSARARLPTCVGKRVCVRARVCMCLCLYLQVRACSRVFIFACCTCAYVRAYVCVCACVRARVRV